MNSPTGDPEDRSIADRIDNCSALMEELLQDRGLLAGVSSEQRRRFLMAAGRVSRPSKRERRVLTRAHRKIDKNLRRDADQALLNQTGIRKLRENPIFLTPRRAIPDPVGPVPEPLGHVSEEKVCYVCRTRFTQIHWFYDQMCQECGDFNHAKRTQVADLAGRTALVTGARVKIGYQAAILMLRSGCRVICLTRFPRDAAKRYAAESDFSEWAGRLEIHGIDLRHTPSVELLCQDLLQNHDRLDFLINNACQTVRRPPAFYEHMLALEQTTASGLGDAERALVATTRGPRGTRLSAAELTQVPLLPEDHSEATALFPSGQLDADQQQVDLRKVNSWRLRTHEVSALELLEVHLVNAVAPYILNARLKPLMLAVSTADKHIVNVSAVEGQFYRTFKSDRHPHTNMAKAALNMMTRTSALDYIHDGIHMNSVDTGWVTDEDPVEHAQNKREMHRFHPPLDIVDGAARIVDPILDGLNSGEHVWGQFLKDYKPTDW
jgi:NAD(P)-dependent dehydrogenase (short-subunit alcohol dehydrogenase family)